MANKIDIAFEEELRNACKTAQKELGINFTRYMKMLNIHGGIGTAKILLKENSDVSSGYIILAEAKKLEYSLEHIILQDRWKDLPLAKEREIAKKRLQFS